MPTGPTRQERRTYLKAAREIITGTRRILLHALASGFAHRLKQDQSFVTDADLAVESYVREELSARFPEHGIIGEEQDDVHPGAALTWVIDPIDGTHSFRHRVPLFSTLLALRYQDEPIVGVIDLPALQRCYSGGLGLGVTCNGQPLRLSDVPTDEDVAQEIIAVGERRQFTEADKIPLFDRLMHAHRHTRTYCDGFGHGMALEGGVGAMVDVSLKVWDVSATEVLVKEAGGTFLCFDRGWTPTGRVRYDVVFGKPHVVAWLRPFL